MKYDFKTWLFYYLLGVVPLNLIVWKIDFVWPSGTFLSLINGLLFVFEIGALIALWYKMSELLASRNTHDSRSQEVAP